GQFLQRFDSRVKHLVAFDGVTGWGVDVSGTPRILEMDDLECAQTLLWVQTGRWLAERGPFTIAVLPEETTDRQISLQLQLKGGVKQARLILDRVTGLPLVLERKWYAGVESWKFEDYQQMRGIALAHKVVHTAGAQVATWVIHEVCEVEAGGKDIYKPVFTRPKDTQVSPSLPASVPIKRVAGGHLFVRPKINGQDVGWFALDTGTGAGMTIAPAAADRLKLPSFGKVVSVGTGKAETTTYRQGATFELGPVTIAQTIYVEMPK